MHDCVIRNGFLADGSGSQAYVGDIAIDGDKITAVEKRVQERGAKEIDGSGLLVTPGFIDIHTHYDGQATWDPILAPTAWHGVTTIVMGNCGVGFAPAAPDRHEWLINLMEGVEDIPGSALSEGIKWSWKTFPEYLDALEAMPRTMDVGAQIPHGAVRAYVMGDRGARNEPPTRSDLASIAEVVESGIRAGAMGFSTSRVMTHKSVTGEAVPGHYATIEELQTVIQAMARAGGGIFEWASDLNPAVEEFALMEQLSRDSGVAISFVLIQSPLNDEPWLQQLSRAESARRNGANLTAQIGIRGVGYLLGWRCSTHPFFTRPSWVSVARLPWDDQLKALKDPAFRARLLSERSPRPVIDKGAVTDIVFSGWDKQFPLESLPDYEPGIEKSIRSLAQKAGVTPDEYAYDLMMDDNGQGLIYLPVVNYMEGNLDHVHHLLNSPLTMVSLSDGGAHCGAACDAGAPTFMLSYWARDRKGPKISLEKAVRRQTLDTASYYGMHDRGLLKPGYLADINVIDMNRLQLERPYIAFDLPAGGRRLMQKARGYVCTMKRGIVTFNEGEHTGALPGRLVRRTS